MFKINYETKTKSGEVLTPFLVEGTTVYCLGKSGKTIIKNLQDFNFAQERKDNIVVVQPVLEITDELFDEEVLLVPPPVVKTKLPEKLVEKIQSTEKVISVKPIVDLGLFDNDNYI
jgi:hypothetical protein